MSDQTALALNWKIPLVQPRQQTACAEFKVSKQPTYDCLRLGVCADTPSGAISPSTLLGVKVVSVLTPKSRAALNYASKQQWTLRVAVIGNSAVLCCSEARTEEANGEHCYQG